jgi:flagellar biosynthesis regulator FlbT
VADFQKEAEEKAEEGASLKEIVQEVEEISKPVDMTKILEELKAIRERREHSSKGEINDNPSSLGDNIE